MSPAAPLCGKVMGQRPPLPTGCPGVDPLAGGVPCGTALRSAVPNARHQMPFAAATTSPNEERLYRLMKARIYCQY